MEKLTIEQLAELREFDSPTVYNAVNAFKIRSRISGFGHPGMLQRTHYEKPMIGYAVTCKVSVLEPPTQEQTDMTMKYYEKIHEMDSPSIAVVQDVDPVTIGGFWGEVQAATHKALGSVGTLTDGAVRDIPEVQNLGYYFHSTAISVGRGHTHIVDYDCPVTICGIEVKPGDLIHADMHGFVIIPPEIAPKLAKACRKIADAELPVLENCKAAIKRGEQITIEQLQLWRKEMGVLRSKATEE